MISRFPELELASKLGSVSDPFCALGSLQHPAAGVPRLGGMNGMKYAGNQDIRECLLSCADDMGAWPKVTKYVS